MATKRPTPAHTLKSSKAEKYLLNRAMHLGYCRESFPAGSVMEIDRANQQLIINGRHFSDTRDFDILKAHGWIEPYSEEAANELKNAPTVKMPVRAEKKLGMPIEQSDEDQMGATIDIRDTQVGKRNLEEREHERKVATGRSANERRSNKMDVQPYDETPEDRVARLQDPEDRKSVKVIHDDRLGYSGTASAALNAGQVVGRKRLGSKEVEQLRMEGKIKAKVGIDTRNEVRRKQNLPPLPDAELVGSEPTAKQSQPAETKAESETAQAPAKRKRGRPRKTEQPPAPAKKQE